MKSRKCYVIEGWNDTFLLSCQEVVGVLRCYGIDVRRAATLLVFIFIRFRRRDQVVNRVDDGMGGRQNFVYSDIDSFLESDEIIFKLF